MVLSQNLIITDSTVSNLMILLESTKTSRSKECKTMVQVVVKNAFNQ